MTSCVTLEVSGTRAVFDPTVGFEVTDLSFGRRSILATAPWNASSPTHPSSREEWVRAWRGGWQCLVPSSGIPSDVDGRHHGFHGNASQSPWEVVSQSATSITAQWRDEGLWIRRTVLLKKNLIRVATELGNDGPTLRHATATEHLALGPAVTDNVEIFGLGGVRTIGPAGIPADQVSDESWAAINRGTRRGLFGVSQPVTPKGVLLNCAGFQVHLRWPTTALPFAWIWQELSSRTESPWDGRTRVLGIEPSSTDSEAGLAHAIERDLAWNVEPGASRRWYVEVELSEGNEPRRDAPMVALAQ